MTTFAKQYAESLAQVSGHTALIADRDQFIAVAGGCKQLLNKAVSRQLEEKVNNRETVIAAKGDRNYVNIAEDIAVDYAWQLITPNKDAFLHARLLLELFPHMPCCRLPLL